MNSLTQCLDRIIMDLKTMTMMMMMMMNDDDDDSGMLDSFEFPFESYTF